MMKSEAFKLICIILSAVFVFSSCQKMPETDISQSESSKGDISKIEESNDSYKIYLNEHLETNYRRDPTRLCIMGENTIPRYYDPKEITDYTMGFINKAKCNNEPQESYTADCDDEYDLVFYENVKNGYGPRFLCVAPEGTDEWVVLNKDVGSEAGYCANSTFHEMEDHDGVLTKYMLNFESEVNGLYKFRQIWFEDDTMYVCGEIRNVPITDNKRVIEIIKHTTEPIDVEYHGEGYMTIYEVEFCEYCPKGWKNCKFEKNSDETKVKTGGELSKNKELTFYYVKSIFEEVELYISPVGFDEWISVDDNYEDVSESVNNFSLENCTLQKVCLSFNHPCNGLYKFKTVSCKDGSVLNEWKNVPIFGCKTGISIGSFRRYDTLCDFVGGQPVIVVNEDIINSFAIEQ